MTCTIALKLYEDKCVKGMRANGMNVINSSIWGHLSTKT